MFNFGLNSVETELVLPPSVKWGASLSLFLSPFFLSSFFFFPKSVSFLLQPAKCYELPSLSTWSGPKLLCEIPSLWPPLHLLGRLLLPFRWFLPSRLRNPLVKGKGLAAYGCLSSLVGLGTLPAPGRWLGYLWCRGPPWSKIYLHYLGQRGWLYSGKVTSSGSRSGSVLASLSMEEE